MSNISLESAHNVLLNEISGHYKEQNVQFRKTKFFPAIVFHNLNCSDINCQRNDVSQIFEKLPLNDLDFYNSD